jgi:hypothetical protein
MNTADGITASPHKIEFNARRAETLDGDVPSSKPSQPGSPAPDASPPASLTPFLVRWQFDAVAGRTVDDTCLVVYPSGQFRLEKSNQSVGGKLMLRAFEDSLDQNELRQLQELLNEPKLRLRTHQNVSGKKFYRGRELTTLTVPRDRQIQQLSFANYLGVHGFVSDLGVVEDPEESLVKPIRKWLKTHIEARKLDVLPDALATRCTALPQTKQP